MFFKNIESNILDLEENTKQNSNLGKKIVKYAGACLLTASIVLAEGVALYDANIDHTKEVCSICQVMDVPVNNEGLTIGIKHQMNEMQKDFANKGMNSTITFDNEYENKNLVTEVINASVKVDENGQKTYFVPAGYTLNGTKGVIEYYATSIEPVIIAELIEPSLTDQLTKGVTKNEFDKYVLTESDKYMLVDYNKTGDVAIEYVDNINDNKEESITRILKLK